MCLKFKGSPITGTGRQPASTGGGAGSHHHFPPFCLCPVLEMSAAAASARRGWRGALAAAALTAAALLALASTFGLSSSHVQIVRAVRLAAAAAKPAQAAHASTLPGLAGAPAHSARQAATHAPQMADGGAAGAGEDLQPSAAAAARPPPPAAAVRGAVDVRQAAAPSQAQEVRQALPAPRPPAVELRSAVAGFKFLVQGPQRGELEAFWRRRLQDLPERGIAVAAGAVLARIRCCGALHACLEGLPAAGSGQNVYLYCKLQHNRTRC